MNENIDLTKILKDCPIGTKLYSPIFGEVYFKEIRSDDGYAIVTIKGNHSATFTEKGFYYADVDGECTLFPSKEQRDWSKFTAPWYKKEKFDPKTLHPYDKVLVKNSCDDTWCCGFFSHIAVFDDVYRYSTERTLYEKCIPYNNDTKYLLGTRGEAPEYYRYWED